MRAAAVAGAAAVVAGARAVSVPAASTAAGAAAVVARAAASPARPLDLGECTVAAVRAFDDCMTGSGRTGADASAKLAVAGSVTTGVVDSGTARVIVARESVVAVAAATGNVAPCAFDAPCVSVHATAAIKGTARCTEVGMPACWELAASLDG